MSSISYAKADIPQLLKWVGNKHRFAEEIVSYMPHDIKTFYEPFLGSGAVLGTLCNYNNNSLFRRFENAVGSDVLPFLIEIFQYVQNDPKTLIDHYRTSLEGYNEDRENKYLEIRARFNNSFNALDFAVLSRTCYSGIVRFRRKDGYMSTPIGPHKPIPPEAFEERVAIWHNILREDVTFLNEDFKNVMDRAREGDLVYCDPPYTHSQAILYGAQEFRISDLWEKIYECKQRGVKVMLSINGTRRSGSEDIGVIAPEGLFERGTFVNCGMSMVNRLQKQGDTMENEVVQDALLLTW
ncbi:DNA adenine methylase [Cohnella panacarvi]|uniref:DNA adenine methylase n=1 Tax=Cohnella panacarvi TaxID=400776 RepID=UPI0004794FD9|nr:Dam family site-specific DNA-(adenine-N6)-methyltransferase [Cohnella panacarvi]